MSTIAPTVLSASLPAPIRRTPTWDRGREIAGHKAITAATGTQPGRWGGFVDPPCRGDATWLESLLTGCGDLVPAERTHMPNVAYFGGR